PVRRYVMRIAELPARMRPLLATTPGITSFLPAGPGVAVQMGYRHPVALRACPVFEPTGLVLIRGDGKDPWTLDKTPQMGDLRAFARVELRTDDRPDARPALGTTKPDEVRVPLRVVPSVAPWKNVTASCIDLVQLSLLRRIAYALPHQTIARTQIAVTPRGAYLRCSSGIEAVPLGTFFVEIHPNLFIPAGYDVIPAVAPEVLYRALGASSSQVLFVDPLARAVAVDEASFVPLETAVLESAAWEPVVGQSIEAALAEKPVDLKLPPLGAFPMGQVEPPPGDEPAKT
ncbi:MAG: hypothetical protein JNL38_06950, partial [Myxococcales bacterium]|nr:hypothetical protein [Myxococcales bacterium]